MPLVPGTFTGGSWFTPSGPGPGEGTLSETPIGATRVFLDDGSDLELSALPDHVANWYCIGGGLWNLDGHTTFVLQQCGGSNVPEYPLGTPFRVEVGATVVFRGRCDAVMPTFTDHGWQHNYTCYSVEYWANKVPVTDPATHIGAITFNLREPNDPAYAADRVNLDVGQIVLYMLEAHEAAFAAEGITGWDDADFAEMNVVPPEPITFSGLGCFLQVRDFAAQWAGDFAFTVDVAGRVRAKKWVDFHRIPYDMNNDSQAGRPAMSRDGGDCYGAVRVRGAADVRSTVLLKSKGDLVEDWTAPQEAAWKYDAFGGGAGVITGAVTASTFLTVTIDPDDATVAFPANSLQGRQASISVRRTVVSGFDDYRPRKVVGNTALTAGGTCVVTLDFPLPVDTGWIDFRLTGQAGGSLVYRSYTVTNAAVGPHLVGYSPVGIAISTASGTSGSTFNVPVGWTKKGAVEFQLGVDVFPSDSKIRFQLPVVYPLNTLPRLQEGNPGLVEPDDVQAGVFFAVGVLEVRVPETGFVGTGFTQDGLAREYVYDVPNWAYEGDTEAHRKLAEMLLETLKDVIREGQAPNECVREDVIANGPFVVLDIVATGASGWTTGMEDAQLSIRQATMSWEEGPGPPLRMEFSLSNRKRFATAPSAFLGLTMTAMGVNMGFDTGFAGYSPYGSSLGGPEGGPSLGGLQPLDEGAMASFDDPFGMQERMAQAMAPQQGPDMAGFLGNLRAYAGAQQAMQPRYGRDVTTPAMARERIEAAGGPGQSPLGRMRDADAARQEMEARPGFMGPPTPRPPAEGRAGPAMQMGPDGNARPVVVPEQAGPPAPAPGGPLGEARAREQAARDAGGFFEPGFAGARERAQNKAGPPPRRPRAVRPPQYRPAPLQKPPPITRMAPRAGEGPRGFIDRGKGGGPPPDADIAGFLPIENPEDLPGEEEPWGDFRIGPDLPPPAE